jgi:hypothetical protein
MNCGGWERRARGGDGIDRDMLPNLVLRHPNPVGKSPVGTPDALMSVARLMRELPQRATRCRTRRGRPGGRASRRCVPPTRPDGASQDAAGRSPRLWRRATIGFGVVIISSGNGQRPGLRR